MTASPAAPDEAVPLGEAEAIARVVALVERSLRTNYASIRPVPRGQHPKTHGCVRAEFVVGAVRPHLRHGLFAAPATYRAWIRFSASAIPPKPDSRRDAHGMSIKVLGVGAGTAPGGQPGAGEQDLLLVNHDVFFCRNAFDYADFGAAVSATATPAVLRKVTTKLSTAAFFLAPVPGRWHPRGLVNLGRVIRKDVENPLAIRYWSQTPYALGPHAVKYSARPRRATSDLAPPCAGEHRLAEAMARQLSTGEAVFEFMVQLQADPHAMPVEDPTVPWSERDSPFETVATIRIPAQRFTSPAQRNFAERLTFTPWQGLPDHRPLGGINRVRRAVYEASARLRAEMNADS